MNQVRLSGVLCTDISLREQRGGAPTASAYLRFSEKEDAILLLSIGPKVKELILFRKGDSIAVVGRLMIHFNHKSGILVDKITGQLSEDEAKEKASEERWNSERRHQRNARSKENRAHW